MTECESAHELTGNVRYVPREVEVGWLRHQTLMIVQVEEEFTRHHRHGGSSRYTRWRDMRRTDDPLPALDRERQPAPPEDNDNAWR